MLVNAARCLWPIPVIVLAITWKGAALSRFAVHLGIALTAAGAVVGAVWALPGWGGNAPVGAGVFVVDAFATWAAIGAFTFTARDSHSRPELAIAAGIGGVLGAVVGFVPAVVAVFATCTGSCL